MFFRIKQSKHAITCHILDDGHIKAKPGLALTPAQIAKMSEQGIPITTQMSDQFFDGTLNPSFDIPLEEQRGVDINDVWNASKTAKARIIDAHKKDKELYG